jgi:thioredoxin reductase (NADPH)
LPGGQLVNTTEVENYPGFENGIMGPDLMIEMRKQTQRMGTTIVDDEAINVDFRDSPFKILTGSCQSKKTWLRRRTNICWKRRIILRYV